MIQPFNCQSTLLSIQFTIMVPVDISDDFVWPWLLHLISTCSGLTSNNAITEKCKKNSVPPQPGWCRGNGVHSVTAHKISNNGPQNVLTINVANYTTLVWLFKVQCDPTSMINLFVLLSLQCCLTWLRLLLCAFIVSMNHLFVRKQVQKKNAHNGGLFEKHSDHLLIYWSIFKAFSVIFK